MANVTALVLSTLLVMFLLFNFGSCFNCNKVSVMQNSAASKCLKQALDRFQDDREYYDYDVPLVISLITFLHSGKGPFRLRDSTM